jgi:hypothetical protein
LKVRPTVKKQYWLYPGLEQIYLEDSFVLGIDESPGELKFELEFVLREGHPLYALPAPGDNYCYRRGALIFRGVTERSWLKRQPAVSRDARGEADMGNIDALWQESDWFSVEGDWGSVRFRAADVHVEIQG